MNRHLRDFGWIFFERFPYVKTSVCKNSVCVKVSARLRVRTAACEGVCA